MGDRYVYLKVVAIDSTPKITKANLTKCNNTSNILYTRHRSLVRLTDLLPTVIRTIILKTVIF